MEFFIIVIASSIYGLIFMGLEIQKYKVCRNDRCNLVKDQLPRDVLDQMV